ncbi:MAG: peptidoglycan-binding protein LysM [Rhodocyclaceae bacterium]|jgi:nucleoid-associated protein YgaU
MGLFDFVKDIGKRIFSKSVSPEEAADKISQEIESAGLGITGLAVAYDGTDCRLSGQCPTQESLEKAVLIAGNIEGVANVTAEGMTVTTPARVKIEYYIIQRGDTLSKIAKNFYGNANLYPRIFDANREVIRDANLIFPGQKIRIPLD